MKKIFLCSVMLLFVIAINSQSYNSIVLNLNDGTKDTILTNEIDSITYDDLGRQIVWSKDSLYRTAISSLNSTTFEKFELPNLLVKTDVIGDWSEMRIHKDGSLIALKKQDGQDLPSDGCMIMPDETLGVLYSSFRIDENGMPKYITINDCVIIVDDYYDNYVDITVAYNDTIAYSLDSIPYSRILTRAWSENNWQRNLTGIIELASGAVSIVGGALLITGSVISETGSLGASTPISIPGILAGSATIAGGLSSINTGREKLYISGASQSNIGETIYYQAAGELIANGPQNAYVPEKYFSYMKDPNYSSQLGKVGWINFLVGLTSGMFDNLFGRTVTWDDIRKYYQGKVITGLSKDITTNSATIRGYISPDITKSLLNGSKIENEYGVILYSSKDETERYIQKEINGNGGTIEYNFYNLKPATPYNYRIFYIDKTNGINILGDIKTFTTYSQTSIEVQSPSKYAYLSKKNITEASHCNEPLWRIELDCPYFNHFSPNVYGFGILPNHGSSVEIPLDVSCIRIWMPEGFINHPNDFGSLRYYYKEEGKEVTIPSRFEYSQIWEEPYPITTSLDNLTPSKNHTLWIEMTNKSGITVKDSVDFISCPKVNTEDFVDMGTGILWATKNLGASIPYELGISGEVYKEQYAGNLPSDDDYKNLFLSCDVYWGNFNNNNGYFLIARNGNSLFLPVNESSESHNYRNYYQVQHKDYFFTEHGEVHYEEVNHIQMDYMRISTSSGYDGLVRLVKK